MLSHGIAYEWMQRISSYMFGHFIVHLVLENTINVVTWLSVLPLYFIDFTTTVPNRHVDIDSDTDHHLISN